MSGQGTDQPPGVLPSLSELDDEGDGATEFYNPDAMASAARSTPYEAPAPPPAGAPPGGAQGDLGNLSSTVAMDVDATEMMRQAVLRQAEEDDQTSKIAPPPPGGVPPADNEPENFGATAMLDPEQMAALQAGLAGLDADSDVAGTAMLDPEEMAAMRAQAGLAPGQTAPGPAGFTPAPGAAPKPDAPVSPFLSQGIQPAEPPPAPSSSKLPFILVGVAVLLGAVGAAAAYLL